MELEMELEMEMELELEMKMKTKMETEMEIGMKTTMDTELEPETNTKTILSERRQVGGESAYFGYHIRRFQEYQNHAKIISPTISPP